MKASFESSIFGFEMNQPSTKQNDDSQHSIQSIIKWCKLEIFKNYYKINMYISKGSGRIFEWYNAISTYLYTLHIYKIREWPFVHADMNCTNTIALNARTEISISITILHRPSVKFTSVGISRFMFFGSLKPFSVPLDNM